MTTASTSPMSVQEVQVLTDLDLLDRYRFDQDQDAFTELVHRYGDMVYATCHRVLGHRELAQEAAQETFYKLLLHSVKINRSLSGWLHEVAVKHALDIRRSNQARQKREVSYSTIHHSDHGNTSWQELSSHVDEALNQLPQSTRQLLVRHYLMGIKQDVLAQEMNVSTATLHRRIQKGLQGLRQSLQSQGFKIGLVVLGSLLSQEALKAAPDSLMMELGKMNLVHASIPESTSSIQAYSNFLKNVGPINLSTLLITLVIVLVAVLACMIFIALAIFSNKDHVATPSYGAFLWTWVVDSLCWAKSLGLRC